jgi:hypothetical protein
LDPWLTWCSSPTYPALRRPASLLTFNPLYAGPSGCAV